MAGEGEQAGGGDGEAGGQPAGQSAVMHLRPSAVEVLPAPAPAAATTAAVAPGQPEGAQSPAAVQARRTCGTRQSHPSYLSVLPPAASEPVRTSLASRLVTPGAQSGTAVHQRRLEQLTKLRSGLPNAGMMAVVPQATRRAERVAKRATQHDRREFAAAKLLQQQFRRVRLQDAFLKGADPHALLSRMTSTPKLEHAASLRGLPTSGRPERHGHHEKGVLEKVSSRVESLLSSVGVTSPAPGRLAQSTDADGEMDAMDMMLEDEILKAVRTEKQIRRKSLEPRSPFASRRGSSERPPSPAESSPVMLGCSDSTSRYMIDCGGEVSLEVDREASREATPMLPPKPDMAIAKQAAEARLARQGPKDKEPGELFDLVCDLKDFDAFGTDVSQYMTFLHIWARGFFLIFLLNFSNIILNVEGQGLGRWMNFFTVATLGNVGGPILDAGGHSYAVIELLTALVLLFLIFYSREQMFAISQRIQHGASRQLRAADFSLQVAQIPESWSSDRLRAYFERWGEVVHVGVSLNYRELILEIHRTQELRNRHTDNLLDLAVKMEAVKLNKARVAALEKAVVRTSSDEESEEHGAIGGAAYRLAELQRRLLAATKDEKRGAMALQKARRQSRASHATVLENEKQIKELMRKRYTCTGYAYVTFNLVTAAQSALAAHQRRQEGGSATFSSLFGGNLRVTRAPDPEDVMWENLQYTDKELRLRSVLANVIILLLCIIGTTTLIATNVVSATAQVEVEGFLQAFGMWLGQLILIVFGHVIVIIGTIILANTLERHRSHGEKERAIMLKIAFFQVVNNVLTVAVVIFIPSEYNDPNRPWDLWFPSGWYPTGAALIVNALIGDLLFIGVVVDGLRPPDLFVKYFLAPRAKTQGRMNELFSIPADITLSMRMQLLCKFLVLGLMYSFAVPILYLLLAGYCWSAQWVDRVNFLRQLRPPPPTHGKSMIWVFYVILPLAVCLHGWFAFKFFSDLCFDLTTHGGAATANDASNEGLNLEQQCYRALGATFGGAAHPYADQAADGLASGCLRALDGGQDLDLMTRASRFFNRTGRLEAGTPLYLSSVSCVTASHGDATSAACAVTGAITTSKFCGEEYWTSAKGIVLGAAILTTIVLFFYLRHTRARILAAERRAVDKTATERRAWRDGSIPSEEANAAAAAYLAANQIGQKSKKSDRIPSVRAAASVATNAMAKGAVAGGKMAAVATAPLQRKFARWTTNTRSKMGSTLARSRSGCTNNACCNAEGMKALRALLAWVSSIRPSGVLLFQCLLQRRPKRRGSGGELPVDAHIRPPVAELSFGSQATMRSPSPAPTELSMAESREDSGRSDGDAPPSLTRADSQPDHRLDEDAVMYLPPLVSTLLNTYCKEVTDQHTSSYLRERDRQLNHSMSSKSPARNVTQPRMWTKPRKAAEGAINEVAKGMCRLSNAVLPGDRAVTVPTNDSELHLQTDETESSLVTPGLASASGEKSSVRWADERLPAAVPAGGSGVRWVDESASTSPKGSLGEPSLSEASLGDVAVHMADATAALHELSMRTASRDSNLGAPAPAAGAPAPASEDDEIADETAELEALAQVAERMELAVEATRAQIAARAEGALRRHYSDKSVLPEITEVPESAFSPSPAKPAAAPRATSPGSPSPPATGAGDGEV